MQTISNGIITIGVKDHGAELASLCHGGREYMWQADPLYWQRHSPVLFPFVGSVWNGEYRTHGQTYAMGQHGFARDMDFRLVTKTDDEIWYRLTSSDDTRARYPYDFALEIGYKLIDNRVRVMWRVTNTGAEPMPFQIGAHPAFYWPLLTDAQIDGGVGEMRRALDATDRRGYFKIGTTTPMTVLPISVVTEKGCIGAQSQVALPADGYMPLTVETFAHDALVFEDSLINSVTICDDDRRPYLTLEFTSPLVGLWSPPGNRAPFVCIEPWYGRADSAHFTGDLADKPWTNILAPDQLFDASYDIVIRC